MNYYYRDGNARLITDAFRILAIDDMLDDLGETNYISTIDLTWAFNQIGVDEEIRNIFGFFVKDIGFLRFKRVAFM